jgi:DNA-3-methyladenine glycosylase I
MFGLGVPMPSYCDYVLAHPEDAWNRVYHDTAYGFPLEDDNALFERLMLEINQAGLSWITILKKTENFRRAYEGFDIARVSVYAQPEIDRLLSDPGIIRNRLKVRAAVENARRIQVLQHQHGSFKAWLDAHHPSSLDQWARLFKTSFVFTGGEIVREFLVSTGYLPGAHDEGCPVYTKVQALNPPWAGLG